MGASESSSSSNTPVSINSGIAEQSNPLVGESNPVTKRKNPLPGSTLPSSPTPPSTNIHHLPKSPSQQNQDQGGQYHQNQNPTQTQTLRQKNKPVGGGEKIKKGSRQADTLARDQKMKTMHDLKPSEEELNAMSKNERDSYKYTKLRDDLLAFSLGEASFQYAERLNKETPDNPPVMALLGETAYLYEKLKNKDAVSTGSTVATSCNVESTLRVSACIVSLTTVHVSALTFSVRLKCLTRKSGSAV
jgi:hypothetical protein